jgi:hypothetical protein
VKKKRKKKTAIKERGKAINDYVMIMFGSLGIGNKN